MATTPLSKLHSLMSQLLGISNTHSQTPPKELSTIHITTPQLPTHNRNQTLCNGMNGSQQPQIEISNGFIDEENSEVQSSNQIAEIGDKMDGGSIGDGMEIKNIPEEKQTEMEVEELAKMAEEKSDQYFGKLGFFVSQNSYPSNGKCLKCSTICFDTSHPQNHPRCTSCFPPIPNPNETIQLSTTPTTLSQRIRKRHLRVPLQKPSKRIKKPILRRKGLNTKVFKQKTEEFMYLQSFLSRAGYRLSASDQQTAKEIRMLERGRKG